jgi:hypothetical protein
MAFDIDSVITDLAPGKVEWSDDIKKSVMHRLLTSRIALVQYMSHFSPDCMPDRNYEIMLRITYSYFENYNVLPTRAVMREEMRKAYKGNMDELILADVMIDEVYDYRECETDVKYIDDRIISFSKREAVKNALKESYLILVGTDTEKFEKIEGLIKDATSIQIIEENISNYAKEFSDRLLTEESVEKSMNRLRTGFSDIDMELDGGLAPGEVGIFMGDSGKGKSQLLAYCSYRNLVEGRNVLFISVENSKAVVDKRFDSIFSRVPMKEIKKHDKSDLVGSIADFFNGQENLRTRCYPMGSVSISDIASEVEMYYQNTGWRPDHIVLDYLDEIKEYSGYSLYDSQGFVVRDFRAWCQVIEASGLSATQANRGASTTNVVTRANIGDSYQKLRRVEALWTLNSVKEEEDRDLMRIFIDKHRNGKSGYFVYLKKDFTMCNFTQITKDEYDKRMQMPSPH